MCSHLFGGSSGSSLGMIGDVVGGLAGAYFGGPVGAAAGAEAGGTLGGVAGGESFGQAATNALPAAGIAGVGTYGAEAWGGYTPGGGSDLFGVSGSPAAPSAVSAGGFAGAPAGSDVVAGVSDTTAASGTDGYIDPSTGLPVPPTPPATAPLPGATAGGTPSYTATGSPTYTDPSGPANDANNAQPGMLSNIANTLGVSKSTLLPAGIAGIGLAKDLLSPSTLQGQSQLSGQAATLANQSKVMQDYLTTGTLPPGVQTSINNATAGAQAAIRAKYASQGLSGSSMETQELNQLQLNAASTGARTAINLYSQGTQDAQISAEIYKTLLSTDVAQQQQTGQAISNLAAALSGGYQQRPQQQPTAP